MVSEFKPAERLKRMKPSGIRRFFSLAKGVSDIISLSLGEPDFSPPKHAIEAGCHAAESGGTHYAPTNGIPELRETLTKKAYRDYGLVYDPESEVLVTVGATEGFFLSMMGLINPGDEVLIPNPGFVLYEPCVLLAGGVPVSYPLFEANRFRPAPEDVTSLITDRSRVIVLNFPNNPTGAVLSYSEAVAIANVAVEKDLIVVSDEVYEKIVYDGCQHHCISAFPGMRERTIVINSFSKTYAMTGLRVGYVYGPRELISCMWLVHQYIAACANSPAQEVALAALRGPQEFVRNMVQEFDKRRRLVYERLNSIKGVTCMLPKGAFYAFPKIAGLGLSSEDFARALVDRAHVTVVPGTSFGTNGEGFVRISYANSYEQLEEALDRIERAVADLG